MALLSSLPGGVKAFLADMQTTSTLAAFWARRKLNIKLLFIGDTDEDDEDVALSKFVATPVARELATLENLDYVDPFVHGVADHGWSYIDSELDAPDLDQIATLMGTLCDRRDYLPWRTVHGGYASSLSGTERHAIEFLLGVPNHRWRDMVADLALRNITAKTIGALPGLSDTDRIAIGEIQKVASAAKGHDAQRLQGVLATCEYADRLFRGIAIPDPLSVLDTIDDIADETDPFRLAAALDVMAVARDTTLAAFLTAAQTMGQGVDQAGLLTLREVLEQVDQIGDPLSGGITGPIQAALDQLAGLVADVRDSLAAFTNSFQGAVDALGRFSLFGGSADDVARTVVSQLKATGTLGMMPTAIKILMCRALLDTDATLDDDEVAILAILGDPIVGARTPGEFFSMYAALGHDSLDSNIDGDESDQLYAMVDRFFQIRSDVS